MHRLGPSDRGCHIEVRDGAGDDEGIHERQRIQGPRENPSLLPPLVRGRDRRSVEIRRCVSFQAPRDCGRAVEAVRGWAGRGEPADQRYLDGEYRGSRCGSR